MYTWSGLGLVLSICKSFSKTDILYAFVSSPLSSAVIYITSHFHLHESLYLNKRWPFFCYLSVFHPLMVTFIFLSLIHDYMSACSRWPSPHWTFPMPSLLSLPAAPLTGGCKEGSGASDTTQQGREGGGEAVTQASDGHLPDSLCGHSRSFTNTTRSLTGITVLYGTCGLSRRLKKRLLKMYDIIRG